MLLHQCNLHQCNLHQCNLHQCNQSSTNYPRPPNHWSFPKRKIQSYCGWHGSSRSFD
ncbi:MAG: pentapeptide repeat-containing protein [Tolypothrix carrinoi HA7290-LM1]|nr:pentapeptide repeat-containing protein [Tolypothrix carrinoi HA7290-LM1]